MLELSESATKTSANCDVKTILIVEDDHAIQDALREVLEGEGFQVHAAYDGAEALVILETSPQLPSCILLDLMMPKTDGFQFRNHQLSDSRLKNIPVVAMSADGNMLNKVAATKPYKCIRKPIDADELLFSINNCC